MRGSRLRDLVRRKLSREPRLEVTPEGVVDRAMTYVEYIQAVLVAVEAHPYWRPGQTYFNILYAHRPDISEAIRGGPYDPFYRDSRIPEFLVFVNDNW